jgi:hypothetical protein
MARDYLRFYETLLREETRSALRPVGMLNGAQVAPTLEASGAAELGVVLQACSLQGVARDAIAFTLGPIVPKSPRSAFKATRSISISRGVRYPMRRKTGTGGHHPWTAC